MDFGTFGDIVETSRYDLLDGYIDSKFAPGQVSSFIGEGKSITKDGIKPMKLPYRSKAKGIRPLIKEDPKVILDIEAEEQENPSQANSEADIATEGKDILVEEVTEEETIEFDGPRDELPSRALTPSALEESKQILEEEEEDTSLQLIKPIRVEEGSDLDSESRNSKAPIIQIEVIS